MIWFAQSETTEKRGLKGKRFLYDHAFKKDQNSKAEEIAMRKTKLESKKGQLEALPSRNWENITPAALASRKENIKNVMTLCQIRQDQCRLEKVKHAQRLAT